MATKATTRSSNHTPAGGTPLAATLAPLGAVLATVAGAAAGAQVQRAAGRQAAGPAGNPLAPNANWQLPAGPVPSKGRPAPKAGTVFGACMAAMGTNGCTMHAMQLAIAALGLRGTHPAYRMLQYAAKHWGYGYTCTNGVVTVQL